MFADTTKNFSFLDKVARNETNGSQTKKKKGMVCQYRYIFKIGWFMNTFRIAYLRLKTKNVKNKIVSMRLLWKSIKCYTGDFSNKTNFFLHFWVEWTSSKNISNFKKFSQKVWPKFSKCFWRKLIEYKSVRKILFCF
jgi:hypothetical protein